VVGLAAVAEQAGTPGTSRDAKPGLMSGPSFADAAFRYAGGTVTLPVTMRY
jgi:hypothetical protein